MVWTMVAPNGEHCIVVYIDDMVIKGLSLQEVWLRTLQVIERLYHAGFKVNLNKAIVLTPSAEMVGYNWKRELYSAGDKAVWKLLTTGLPRNYHEVL